MKRWKNGASTMTAVAFVLFVVIAGYVYLGGVVAGIFALGYGAGLALWLIRPVRVPFDAVRLPFWWTLAAFVLHKVEENRMQFFEALARDVTGVPVPDLTVMLVVSLLIVPVGAWVAIPWMMGRHALGTLFAYTFFASMALSEAAHFVFPVVASGTFGYFPGVASAVALVPLGMWGLHRLRQGRARDAS